MGGGGQFGGPKPNINNIGGVIEDIHPQYSTLFEQNRKYKILSAISPGKGFDASRDPHNERNLIIYDIHGGPNQQW